MNAPDLYRAVWDNDTYRLYAPGAQCVGDFLDMARPDGEVIDFGAGTGRGAWLIHTVGRVPVRMIDFADNCLDRVVRDGLGEKLRFETQDLRTWHEPLAAQWGYCTDVMEHIEPKDVDAVLWNIVRTARFVFFSISTTPDDYGNMMVGEPLHLTVENHEWWRKKFEAMHCKVIWEREDIPGKLSQWYVTAYVRGSDLGEYSSHNTAAEQVKANVKANMDLGLPEVQPYQEQDTHIVLLAGGPSLADGEAEILELARSGAQVVTTNGTYGWAMARGITPGAQIMVDAREFNARFCQPMNDRTRFLVCSQCDPEFVSSLPHDQVVLWHAGGSNLFEDALKEYAQETGNGRDHWPVPGGTTVMNRALPLLMMLGFRRFTIFGWDSCVMGDKHHAYAQPENDGDAVRTLDMKIGDRTWRCAGWMAIQAHEFVQMVKMFPDDVQLDVRGDGLLAGILQFAADKANEGA
jgi:hypothetical protein